MNARKPYRAAFVVGALLASAAAGERAEAAQVTIFVNYAGDDFCVLCGTQNYASSVAAGWAGGARTRHRSNGLIHHHGWQCSAALRRLRLRWRRNQRQHRQCRPDQPSQMSGRFEFHLPAPHYQVMQATYHAATQP